MKIKSLLVLLLFTLFILLIPFVAMQYSNEVNWSIFDFLIGGLIIFSGCIILNLIWQKTKKHKLKYLYITLTVIILVLIWAELAVGIFGSIFAGN